MKLVFLGTRGYIEARGGRHRMHSALQVSYYGKRVMVDCGEDWSKKVTRLPVDAIFITHAHPDHAWGLKQGARCPVYATKESWQLMGDYEIEERRTLKPRTMVQVHRLVFEPFPVTHSTHAPAVAFRVTAGKKTVFYAPDIVHIPDRGSALKDVDIYIGDGATVKHSMVRKIKGKLIGHAPITTQLTWCEKEGVPRAIFTHCGSAIVEGDERRLGPQIRKVAESRNVDVEIAHDGMELVLK